MDIFNSPLVTNLENGNLPVVNVQVHIPRQTIVELCIGFLFVFTMALVVSNRLGK